MEDAMLARTRLAVVVVLFGLPVPMAHAWSGLAAHARLARVEWLLGETPIEGHTLGETVPFDKLLAALSARLPKDAGFSITLDRDGLGDDAARVAALPVRVHHGADSIQGVLHHAIAQVAARAEVDYAVRSTGVVVTRPRLAATTRTYELDDALRVPARLLDDRTTGPLTPARLAEFLAKETGLRPWETVDVLNGRRLSMFATPARHLALGRLVTSLTRLADLGVYMNARLYAMDRAFYQKHVAPVVAGQRDEPAPVAVRVERPLLGQVLKHALVQESDDTKLEPERRAVFLARERLAPGVGLTGVSVAVRPEVSPDRRYLRLHLTRSVAEAVRPEAKGPDEPAAEASLRKTRSTGTVEVRDGEAILMPIPYRPPGHDANRVWVLVARPLIWIEAEARERGDGFRPRGVWDDSDWDELTRELGGRAKPLPATAEARAILQAVLTHVLTDKEIADSRKFYGTEADRTVLLSNTGHWAWPDGFQPDLHGYRRVASRPGPFAPRAKRNRVLGIRIDRFEPGAKVEGPFNAPIQVCLFNAGGQANGAVIGGCSVFYAVKKVGDWWAVEFTGLEDP
jgi:hypothetical protein